MRNGKSRGEMKFESEVNECLKFKRGRKEMLIWDMICKGGSSEILEW